jgi:putative NIF3 family GTP cyclohydrolase 1 type 2
MEIGAWVDWERTCDQFLFGEAEEEVKGIAVAWSPPNSLLKQAAEKGLNLFITHEPAFYHRFAGKPSAEKLRAEKEALLQGSGTALLRCHDTWDRMPDYGIVDAWAEHLGFATEPRSERSFYRICLTENRTVKEIGDRILQRVRPLGQSHVMLIGEAGARAGRLAVGTGAITGLPDMYELDADLILATDDGMNFWNGGLWAVDLPIPVLLVNHATSEKPGMKSLAGYLAERFPDLPVEYLDVPFPYTVMGP